jgi:hypothetical protein
MILSSERILHKGYGRKDSVTKKTSLVVSLEGLRQDELIAGKPAVLN